MRKIFYPSNIKVAKHYIGVNIDINHEICYACWGTGLNLTLYVLCMLGNRVKSDIICVMYVRGQC